ncbi:MAG: hypothetical protein Q9182_006889 [Xanthomendoza sp. 2 TL-2023]
MGLDKVKNILLVLSGKGGVGKSSITTQLALALSLAGHSTGILDIDLTGPSIPRLLGLEDAKIKQAPGGWLPVQVHPAQSLVPVSAPPPPNEDEAIDPLKPQDAKIGTTLSARPIGALYAISLGFLLPSRDSAVVWRGPKKTAMVRQFLTDVMWPELEYLLIDTPPGTSDEHISLAETLLQHTTPPTTPPHLAGAIVVTTPQAVSISDVRKELSFCRKVGIGVLGVVENMSGYVCECCGAETDLFQKGGGRVMAEEFGVRFLGAVPVDGQWGVLVEEGKRPRYGGDVSGDGGEGWSDEEDERGVEVLGGKGLVDGRNGLDNDIVRKSIEPNDELLVDKYRNCSLCTIFEGIARELVGLCR